ncbi:MAG: response regulator [Desulfomonilaceae bacterium]
MSNQFTLLIADRNRHVRDFLRREFMADGYAVELARDDRELLSIIEADEPPDLLIVDLEMPCSGGPEAIETLLTRNPLLPVVVHTFLTEEAAQAVCGRAAAFLEKRGNNIDHLKQTVLKVLRKCYPHRFPLSGEDERAPLTSGVS